MLRQAPRWVLAVSVIAATGCAGIRQTAEEALAVARAAQTSATSAERGVTEVRQAASGAQTTANQALAAAQAAQACCDATNQKVDRMFEQNVGK
jgi:hypothetical protein